MHTYDYLKYGIGIGTNIREIDFGNLVFDAHTTVSVSHGTVEPLTLDMHTAYVRKTGTEYSSTVVAEYLTEHVKDAYVVTIGKEASGSIIDLHITQKGSNGMVYVLVIIERGVDVIIREVADVAHVRGITVDVVVKDDARCTYLIQNTGTQHNYMFGIHTARVMRDAQMMWVDMNSGGAITKQSIVTHLVEPGAAAQTYGIFFGQNTEVYDLYTATEHLASHTVSDMFVRGVLGGTSSAIYRGLVKVHAGAAGCTGYQQEDTLLMSSGATVSSVPDLEILNNDVRCSHGVTTTHIDDLKLFYARSRGMTRSDAEQQFVLGHIGAVLAKIPEAARTHIDMSVFK